MKKKVSLVVHCRKHRSYRAHRAPASGCKSCILLYILHYQHHRKAGEFLGGLNPYAYLINNLEEACEDLAVRVREEKPALKITRQDRDLMFKPQIKT